MLLSLAVLVARVALCAIFLIAGVGKLANSSYVQKAMAVFGAPDFLRRPLAALIAFAELGCAIALLAPAWMYWGAIASVIMLSVFTVLVVITLARGIRPDCQGFGQRRPSQLGGGAIARNLLLAAIALFILWQGPRSMGAGQIWLGFLNSLSAQIGAVFLTLLCLQIWTTVHLLRQNGRLLLRVKELESGAPKREPKLPGLPVKSIPPDFNLAGLDGSKVGLQELMGRAGSLMLVFIEPGCEGCEDLLPDVARWQTEHQDRLTIVPISRGTLKENQSYAGQYDLRGILLQTDREVSKAYLVTAMPSAVLVKDGKVARPLAEGTEEIQVLHARAILPPTLKVGEPIPSIVFPDLSGRPVDLSTLRGRRRVLVFWSTTCSFCQGALTDLKNWERNPQAGAPEMLVISAGSRDVVLEQGFMAQVLLDDHFLAGTLFGVPSTPSAVLIDEEGRVASKPTHGPIAMFDLAGAVPFVPSPEKRIEAMLALAEVQNTDVLYDLGCGDGRIVVAAARNFGIRAVGIDINPDRIKEANANARKAGVEDLVRFEVNNLADAEFREATVVCLYLLPNAMRILKPRLQTELKPGSRIVSHDFEFEDWEPDEAQRVEGSHWIKLWRITDPLSEDSARVGRVP